MASIHTRRLVPVLLIGLLAACGAPSASTPSTSPTASSAAAGELDGIKTYLLGQTTELNKHAAQLKTQADQYCQLA
jgi:hypothetical protein